MKLSDLTVGDTVVTDCGFTCMSAGPKIVQQDDRGSFYVACDEGEHHLDGQEDENGELIGVTHQSGEQS